MMEPAHIPKKWRIMVFSCQLERFEESTLKRINSKLTWVFDVLSEFLLWSFVMFFFHMIHYVLCDLYPNSSLCISRCYQFLRNRSYFLCIYICYINITIKSINYVYIYICVLYAHMYKVFFWFHFTCRFVSPKAHTSRGAQRRWVW